MKRLFSSDPLTGIKEYFHYDEMTDQVTMESQQQVDDILEANATEYREVTSLDRWGDGKRVASIPLSIYLQMVAEGKTKDQAYLRRWLNDPENRIYRTRPGKV